MLDLSDSRKLNEEHWKSLDTRVELPCSPEEFWDRSDQMDVIAYSQRRYHRHGLREMAILRTGETDLAVYTKDLSRMGLGFYSPIQLFPGDEVELAILGRKVLSLQVTRCLRLANKCFDCGADFSLITGASK